MIEYLWKLPVPRWHPASSLSLSELRLYSDTARINGVKYNIFTKEFEEEFNKIKVWRKLSA